MARTTSSSVKYQQCLLHDFKAELATPLQLSLYQIMNLRKLKLSTGEKQGMREQERLLFSLMNLNNSQIDWLHYRLSIVICWRTIE